MAIGRAHFIAINKNDEQNQEKMADIYLQPLHEEPDYARKCKESVKENEKCISVV